MLLGWKINKASEVMVMAHKHITVLSGRTTCPNDAGVAEEK